MSNPSSSELRCMRTAFLLCTRREAPRGWVCGAPVWVCAACSGCGFSLASLFLSLRLFGLDSHNIHNRPPDSQGSPESRTGRNLSYAMPDGEVSRGRPRTLITGRGVRTQVSRLSPTPAFRQLWTCPSLPYGISWLPKAWGHSPPKHTLCVSVGMALPPYSVASSSIHSVNVSWVSLKEMGHMGGLEAWERSAQIGVDSGKGAGGVRPVRRGFSIQGRKCESLK